MANYLLIESRDPFTSNDTSAYTELAMDLVKQGNDVTLFLVENGVFPARLGAFGDTISGAAKAGVTVLAEEFALRERGIGVGNLAEGVRPAPIERIVDELAAGAKALWH